MERDERVLDNRFKYIEPITIDELRNTVDKEDLERFEAFEEKLMDKDLKFADLKGYELYYAHHIFLEKDFKVTPLDKVLSGLNEEERAYFGINDLKTGGFNVIFPTDDDLVKLFGNESRLVEERLNEYFSNQKHIDIEREKFPISFSEKLLNLYNKKEINNPDLKDMIEGKLTVNFFDRNLESRKLFLCFLKTLSAKEKAYLLPETVEKSKEMATVLSNILEFGQSTEGMRAITGFANLNLETIDGLSKHLQGKKCLEICSGSGLLANELQMKGIDVIPTDIANEKDNGYYLLRTEPYTKIEQIDGLSAIEKFDADVLIMSWPPFDDPIAANALEKFIDKNPNGEIIYIGESEGGCTADNRFFELIYEHELTENHLNINYEPTPFAFLHDNIYSFSKKNY